MRLGGCPGWSEFSLGAYVIFLVLSCGVSYRIIGYFRVAKFLRFCLKKTWGLFFAEFNIRGRQRPRKIILILFRENYRVGGTTRPSFNRLTVRKENIRQKYLKRKGIKDTCSLTDCQTKTTYLHSDSWIKWLFRTKQWNVCLACLLLELWQLGHMILFAITQRVVYSQCYINATILFNKEIKTISCMSNTTTKEN